MFFFAKEESSWTNCIRGLADLAAVGSATAATLLIEKGFLEYYDLSIHINVDKKCGGIQFSLDFEII